MSRGELSGGRNVRGGNVQGGNVRFPNNRLMSYGQKAIFKMAAVAISNLKISIFGLVTVIGFNIWCSVPNFVKIGRFFTEIWRYNDFQIGGRLQCWIFKICSFCHIAHVDLPFYFVIHNFAEIGQLVDDSWPKGTIFKMAAAAIVNFKHFNFWSRDCHWVQYLL